MNTFRYLIVYLCDFQEQISQHGNTVTDNAPVVKIKAAVQKLREEMTNMDLRIGVLSHTVMQHKFREKKDGETGNIPGIFC